MEIYTKLEAEIAKWAGYEPEQVVACASGTAALHLALEAFRLPQGTEVIVPDFGMIAIPRAVSLAGLKPIFVDCRSDLNIDPGLVSDLIDSRWPISGWEGTPISAMIYAHTYGRECDNFRLRKATESFGIMTIEDMAEAHGIRPYVCDAACWSFYRNKIVHGEEGGAVAFRDVEHADLARSLRCLGFTTAHDFTHIPRGHNYRMSNVHAGLILDSLRVIEREVALRRQLEDQYDELCPIDWRMPTRQAPWVYDLRILGLSSDKQTQIVQALNEKGIRARYAFKPLSFQEEYKGSELIKEKGKVCQSQIASREVFYLPLTKRERANPELAFRTIREIVNA